MKQLRTPNNKHKLKIHNSTKIASKVDAKLTMDKPAIIVPDIIEVDGDNRNTESCNEQTNNEACKLENNSKPHIEESLGDEKTEDPSWTRVEDKKILIALQTESENESALQKICRLLPHRSEEEVIVRLQEVMKLLHKIMGDK